MKVYTKIGGKLASWEVQTDSHIEAISAVREVINDGYRVVLAVIPANPGIAQQAA